MSETRGFIIGCDYAGTMTVSNERDNRSGHIWQDDEGNWTTVAGLVRLNLPNGNGITLTYDDARIMAQAILGMTD